MLNEITVNLVFTVLAAVLPILIHTLVLLYSPNLKWLSAILIGIVFLGLMFLGVYEYRGEHPNPLAGSWVGTINSSSSEFTAEIRVSISDDCEVGNICGSYMVHELPCNGDLRLESIQDNTYVFIEEFTDGADFCDSGGTEYMNLLSNETISWTYNSRDRNISSTANLEKID